MNRKLRNTILWVLFGSGLLICGACAYILTYVDEVIATDLILYGTYAFAALTLLAVLIGVVIAGAISDWKFLVKLGIAVAIVGSVVTAAWLLAPGTPPVGYLGDPVEPSTLKLTDTILNLTYMLLGATAVALIVGRMISLFRK